MNFSTDHARQISILHVEDSDADAERLLLPLKQARHENKKIYRARSVKEALRFLSHTPVDLIFLNLFLPDSKGLDTLKRLRTHSPENAIVVITGTDKETTAALAVNSGAQDYLIKDELTPRTLARAIRYSIERHDYDRRMMELANVDMLTGLPNRARFMDYLQQAINSAQRLRNNLSLLYIDCDHFKLINDTYGHLKGDEFLVNVSRCLKHVLRSSDFAARLAGDEFIIALQTRNQALQSPLTVAEKILASLKGGVYISSGEKLDARCSIGITNYDGRSNKPTPDKLIHEADAAMYLSKRRGGNCASFFDRALEKQAERRLLLLRDIRGAFRDREFYLSYQPICLAGERSVIGLEALLRWKTRRGELVAPTEFIPLLEENSLIQALGEWITRQACDDFLALKKQGYLAADTWLSLNISPVQLQAKDFAQKLARTIEDTGIPPQHLHLEITESLLMEKQEQTFAMLHDIKTLGCMWAIDDFGVGYSSMSYLKNLPIRILKIDRSFVQNCCHNDQDLAITKAMIALAHKLNMKVVAEGVETGQAAALLYRERCDFLQGYWFNKPMAIDDLKSALLSHSYAVADTYQPVEKGSLPFSTG